MKREFLAILLVSAAACSRDDQQAASSAASVPEKPAVGFRAPAYSAVTLAGDSVSLASYRGRVVLINAWATWCGPCRQEIPELRLLYKKYKARGFTVVGVTVDAEGTESQIKDFVEQFGMDYPIWHDPSERISAQYATLGLPASFLIDRQGIIRWKSTGAVAPGDTSLARAIRTSLETH